MSSRSLRSRGRKIGVAALAASLGLAGLGLAASPASALPGFQFERLAGTDRIETAVDISQDTFATSATALIARADLYPDALAGNYLAGAEQAPILLSHTDDVPAETLAELDRLNVTEVTLLGGTAALDSTVEDELEAAGYTVTREAGTDRYKTAAEIATSQDAATIGEVDGLRTAILATGEKFPDALAGGPLAYAGSHPILLTPTATLGSDAAGALDTLGIEHVLILGGTAAVSDAAETAVEAMGITTQRLAGTTRYSTAVAIAEFALTQGFVDTHANVATGQKFPDALTGGPHAGEELAPILLANDGNTAEACAYLEGHADTLTDGHIYGGTAAVSAAAEAILEECAQTGAPATNQTFAVAGETQGSDLGPDGVRTCNVTGITPGAVVDVALFPSEDVRVAEDGTVTFTDAAGDNLADNEGNTLANIVNINGTNTDGADEQNNVVAATGVISVTLSSAAVDDVTLVVFQENPGFTGNTLDLTVPAVANNNPKTPREAFGIGCRTLFANEAAGGLFGPVTVSATDKTANLFTAGSENYFYDANDTFQIGGVPQAAGEAGLTAFEARLSPGDSVSGTYATDPAGVSTFNLDDLAPAPVTALTATASGTTVTLQYTGSATLTTDSYNIYRIVRPANGICPNFDTAGATGRNLYPATPTATQADPTPSAAGGTITFTDTGLAANTAYCYAVTAVDDGDESGATTAQASATTTTVGTAPTIQDVRARDAGTVGLVDAGDLHQFIFSEPMAPTVDDAGQLYRIQDADGSVAEVTCGGNAVCVLEPAGTYNGTAYPANQVLRVDITGAVAPITGFLGTVPGVQYPATITNVSAGWDDAGGTQLDLAGSPDKVINVDTITPAGGADLTAPTATSNDVVAGNTTQTITFSEAINPASLVCGDITTNSTETCTGIVMSAGNTVATVTYLDPLEAGDILTLAAGGVTDVAGNAGPAAALNETV